MENLEQIGKVIEGLIEESLLEKRYRFGVPVKKGLSNKYASGSLVNSISLSTTEDTISISMNNYWAWVQQGRFPGKKGVPVSALEKWIKDKGLKPRKGQTIRQMAFGIMFHQKKYGIPSEPGFMDIAIEKIYENKEIEELLGDLTVDDLINSIEGL